MLVHSDGVKTCNLWLSDYHDSDDQSAMEWTSYWAHNGLVYTERATSQSMDNK